MIEKLLASCLRPVLEAEMQLRRRRVIILTLSIGLVGMLALFAASRWGDWWSWPAVFGWMGCLSIGAAIGLSRATGLPDMRALARLVEENHPDLQAALLAAMDQKPSVDGELSFLQLRLLADVSEHAIKHRWVRQVSQKRLLTAAWGQFVALAGFCLSVWLLLGAAPGRGHQKTIEKNQIVETDTSKPVGIQIQISPGDTEIEKGSRLVIEATFSGRAPTAAMVEFETPDGILKFPMNVGLDDTSFSALIPKVDQSGDYRVSYETKTSEDYKIAVFEYPTLSQADAIITPPAYLDEPVREIIDTRKITVMEGSRIDWRIKVNKPIATAELFAEDETMIPLTPDADDSTILLASHSPTKTQRYRLHLIDSDDRANRRPPWLTVNVKKNVPPKLKLTFPGRDFDVSAVQEMPVEAEVWDDVGVETAGFTYQFGEAEKSIVLTANSLAGGEKHPLISKIDIEELGAKPRDLISYHFWAEDRDKEGNPRRTTSDMFFAEVRFFEEIIREGQPQQGKGEPGESEKLLKLQKDIINASWKLRRDHDLGRPFDTLSSDLIVVFESQMVVITLVDEAIAKAEDAKLKKIFTEAKALMEQAASEFALVISEQDGDLITPAHKTALAVYAKLIEARSRESEISMSQSQSQGSSQQEQQRNMNLELKQKELKYEEKSSAEEESQSAEQKEDLAVLNRLKELARRQEAIAEKIKELENQLQNASPEEKAEIERQLKRLQEEQRELLREVDDLSERMDSEENRANMAEEREQLEDTREDIQETAEQLDDGDLAAAANSATRAQEELEQMEEQFRERTSRQFTEEMRGLREKARQLAENQDSISTQLEELTNTDDSDPFSDEGRQERAELAAAISEQVEELDEVLNEVKTLSEQSEVSEPLLSDALYETFRDSKMNGVQESLEEARKATYYNRPNQARTPEQAAARGIAQLQEGIESAAEKVLGNEADALRLARSELDRLIEDSREESQRLAGGEETSPNAEMGPEGQESSESKDESGQPGDSGSPQPSEKEGTQQAQAGNPTGSDPPQGSSPSEQPGEGKGNAQEPSPGEQASQTPGSKGKGSASQQGSEQMPGETPGSQPGQGSSPQGLAQGQQPGQGDQPGGEGQGKGKGKGQPGSPNPGQAQQGGSQSLANNGSRAQQGSPSLGGDDRGSGTPSGGNPKGQPLFFNRPAEESKPGPITGEDYSEWADRLGNIEEMLPQDDLRNSIAKVLDEARSMRIDFARNNHAPESGSINQRITEPLLELRQRLSEEIAKLNKENPIAPIDRDPVPSEFRDLVRRYYEELGAGK